MPQGDVRSAVDNGAAKQQALYTARECAPDITAAPQRNTTSTPDEATRVWLATTSTRIEFSARAPMQRPEWGATQAVAVDDRGIAALHRHQSAAGGVFVLSSLQVEVAAGMPVEETKAWCAGLLSRCQATS